MSTGSLNLKIGSGITFNLVGGSLDGLSPYPQLQTVKTLDGVYYTTSSYIRSPGPILSVNVSELTTFVSTVNIQSTKQTVKMTNDGSSILNITDIIYTYSNEVTPRLFFSATDTILNGNRISIVPGNTATFQIAYIGSVAGSYSNYFVIVSNDSTLQYFKVNTQQIIQETKGLRISPLSFNTSTTRIGEKTEFTYKLIPIFNEVEFPNTIIPYSASMSGTGAWSISNNGNNAVTVKFNSWEVNNVNGTYASTLTVVANGITTTTINTSVVNISTLTNKNIITWISPVSKHNSIIAISYDLSEGNRYLTIGVGLGGEGLPIYDNGGSVYKDINAIGLGADSLTNPYPFWANVTKIKFTNTSQTYYSGDWEVKNTNGLNYPTYFGNYNKRGSMFIVEDDGYGSLTIELNYLRELSGNPDFDATLKNLTRAFHYYSNVDLLGRVSPLPTEYASPLTDYTTSLFTGFNYNTRTQMAFVNTSIVDLPV